MSWIQQNKLPAAILGVSAAGVAGLGFMLFSAYTSYEERLAQYNTINNSIAGLKSATLAPTPENLAIKQGLVAEFTKAAGDLSYVLTTMQSESAPKPTTDTEFQATLKTTIAESRKFAAQYGMALPATYHLEFGRYTSELPKSNEMATELSGYLDAVNSLVNVFAKSGVRQLDSLTRAELDSEKAVDPKKPAARPQARPGQPAPAAPGAQLVQRRQVSANLTLDQAALQVLLSNLASPSEMKYFTVVRLIRIENERQLGPLRSEADAAQAAAQAAVAPEVAPAPEGQAAPVTAATAAAPVDAVAVLGNERLRVYLEVDFVNFLGAPTAATGTR